MNKESLKAINEKIENENTSAIEAELLRAYLALEKSKLLRELAANVHRFEN